MLTDADDFWYVECNTPGTKWSQHIFEGRHDQAELIMRAVNNHEALVAALGSAKNILDNVLAGSDLVYFRHLIAAALADVEKALAQAKGGK